MKQWLGSSDRTIREMTNEDLLTEYESVVIDIALVFVLPEDVKRRDEMEKEIKHRMSFY